MTQHGMYTAPRFQSKQNVVTNDLLWRERMKKDDGAAPPATSAALAAPWARTDSDRGQEPSVARQLRQKLERAMETPPDDGASSDQPWLHAARAAGAAGGRHMGLDAFERGLVPRHDADRLRNDRTPRLPVRFSIKLCVQPCPHVSLYIHPPSLVPGIHPHPMDIGITPLTAGVRHTPHGNHFLDLKGKGQR